MSKSFICLGIFSVLFFKAASFESSSLRKFGQTNDDFDDTQVLKVNRRIYNSSIALTIPFFSFKIPHLSEGGFLANQAIFGVFAWGITALTFGMSFIFTGDAPSDSQRRSFQTLSNSARKSSLNFLGESFSQSFGMDGMQCIQKVICQANREKEAKKYGLLAKGVRALFPAPENVTLGGDPSSSPFKAAAVMGKLSTGKDCDSIYDCMLDPFGALRYLTIWYGHNHEGGKALLQILDWEDKLKGNVTIN